MKSSQFFLFDAYQNSNFLERNLCIVDLQDDVESIFQSYLNCLLDIFCKVHLAVMFQLPFPFFFVSLARTVHATCLLERDAS